MNTLDISKLGQRTKLAIWAAYITAAFMALAAIGQILESVGVINIETDSDVLTMIVAFAYVIQALAFIISVVLVAMWINRAFSNLREAGIDTEYSPGWAVGWFFIPFANLVKPYQAMRELWNTSHREENDFSGEAPSDIKLWWGCWIIGNILTNIGTRMAISPGDSSYTMGAMIGAVGTAVLAASAVLLAKIMQQIWQAQRDGTLAAHVFA